MNRMEERGSSRAVEILAVEVAGALDKVPSPLEMCVCARARSNATRVKQTYLAEACLNVLLCQDTHVLVHDLARPVVSVKVTDHAVLALHRAKEFFLVGYFVVLAVPCVLRVQCARL